MADFSELLETLGLLLCTIIVDDTIQLSITPVSVREAFSSSIWHLEKRTGIEGGVTDS